MTPIEDGGAARTSDQERISAIRDHWESMERGLNERQSILWLLDRLAAIEAKLARKDEALRVIESHTVCLCAIDYTRHGKHEPNAACFIRDIARAAIGENKP